MAGKKNKTKSKMPFLRGKIAMKAMATFDRASALVVLVVWSAAILLIGLSYLGVQQTLQAREKIAEAKATQPVLPDIHQDPVDPAMLEVLTKKVTRHFGTKVGVVGTGGEIKISATNADSFQPFLESIAFLDSLSPDVVWTIRDFCVGQGCKDAMMTVDLTASKVSFTAPSGSQDN